MLNFFNSFNFQYTSACSQFVEFHVLTFIMIRPLICFHILFFFEIAAPLEENLMK